MHLVIIINLNKSSLSFPHLITIIDITFDSEQTSYIGRERQLKFCHWNYYTYLSPPLFITHCHTWLQLSRRHRCLVNRPSATPLWVWWDRPGASTHRRRPRRAVPVRSALRFPTTVQVSPNVRAEDLSISHQYEGKWEFRGWNDDTRRKMCFSIR